VVEYAQAGGKLPAQFVAELKQEVVKKWGAQVRGLGLVDAASELVVVASLTKV